MNTTRNHDSQARPAARRSNGTLTQRPRWPGGRFGRCNVDLEGCKPLCLAVGLTVALAAGSGLAQSQQAEVAEEAEVVEMTENLQAALGPGAISATSIDEKNTQVIHLRGDLYQQVLAATTPATFPIPASEIIQVIWIGGPQGRVLVIYESSPAKVLDCRTIGGTFTCYTS